MRHISLPWFAAISLVCAAGALAATRPHYGGILRIEVRQAYESADPPQSGRGLAELAGAFRIMEWEAGRHVVYAADENAPGGRPFLDGVDVQMGRSLRDRTIDLDLNTTDLVEFGSTELRRAPAARSRLWSSAPVRLVALVFGTRVEERRVREALALAVDRTAILNVLLQRQGEASAALLPQWLSGYAFVFPAAADVARARALVSGLAAAQRTFSLGVQESSLQPLADRIAVNARDAGLMVMPAAMGARADVRLVEVRLESADPAAALAGVAAALGLPEIPRADTPDALLAAERSLLEGCRVIPLFHLPEVYGVQPRVKGGPGITPLGEWRVERLWLEAGRP